MAQEGASGFKLRLETEYKRWQPMKISLGFYGAALFLTLLALTSWGRRLYWAGGGALAVGFAVHGLALLLRMMIMGRPPVTNLYASIVFVGFIVVLVGLVYEARLRNCLGFIVAAVAGVVLQFIGLKYDIDGDTMGMLVAVLEIGRAHV